MSCVRKNRQQKKENGAISIYFLDTCSIIEIIKKNKNFEKIQEITSFTGLMNLLEVHYHISRELGEKEADLVVEKLKSIVIECNIEDVRSASRFRVTNVKKKLSYIDCLGYVMAKNRKLKFLTGDKEFEHMENVEYVK